MSTNPARTIHTECLVRSTTPHLISDYCVDNHSRNLWCDGVLLGPITHVTSNGSPTAPATDWRVTYEL